MRLMRFYRKDIICFFSLLFACLTHTTINITIDYELNSGWTLENSNGSINLKNLTIPLSVHNALLDAKLINDPLYRYNDINLRWIIYEPKWTLRKNFHVNKIGDSIALLQFNSIDTISTIYLNDKLVLTTQNQFLKYTTDAINSFLINGTNKLLIQFESPVLYAKLIANKYPYRVPVDCPKSVQKGECHVNFLRKEQCSFSWDWGPAFAPIGINDKIILKMISQFDFDYSISTYPLVKGDLDNWVIDLKLDFQQNLVKNEYNNSNNTIEFKISELGYKFNLDNVKILNETKFSLNYKLNISAADYSMKFWYPRDYGDQNMYKFNLKIIIFDKSVTKSGSLAFRSVELVQEKIENASGLTFYFKINDQPIFLKGSNWIPMNVFKDRLNKDYLLWLFESMLQANMNVLRVWGGGVYETDDFYNTADKYGIMIWQDFMFACSMYPTNSEYLDNVNNEVDYQVNRLKYHPSIIAWSGNNENEAALAFDWYNTELHRTLYEKDYRTLYIDTIRKKVIEIDPNESRPFISSSPSNGIKSEEENWIAKNPYDPLYGDVHHYDYIIDGWDPDSYPITRFLSEFGFQSLPSFSTLSTAYDQNEDMYLFSSLNSHRQHHETGNEEIFFELSKHFNVPKMNEFNETIYLSQVYQAMSLKTAIELCRRNRDLVNKEDSKGFCMGVMYWQLNDIWQAPTWSSIEYGGRWKIAHYYIRTCYGNLLVSPVINKRESTLDVYLIADILPVSDIQNTIKVNIYRYYNFTPVYTEIISFEIKSFETQIVKKLDIKSIEKNSKCKFDDEYSKCLITFEFDDFPYDISAYDNFLFSINKFYKASIHRIDVVHVTQFSDYEYLIRLHTHKISLFVHLDIVNPNIVGFFSSNGFHMTDSTYDILFIAMNKNFTVGDLKNALVVNGMVFL